jgi:DNA-binding LacI/PurR family transcriptional regulator
LGTEGPLPLGREFQRQARWLNQESAGLLAHAECQPEIAEEVERQAQSHDYQMFLCNTHYDVALGAHYLQKLTSRWVDGAIIMGSSMDLNDIMTQYHRGFPIVLCNWQENETPASIPQVTIDYRAAGRLAEQHLIDLGHREIAIIVDMPQQNHRLEGFRAALADQNIPLPSQRIEQGNSTLEGGYAAARILLTQAPRPSAIFASTDWMALGALEAAHDLGLHVPADLSVIGLDDILVAAHVTPALTTIVGPKQQLAQAASYMLLQQLQHQTADLATQFIAPTLRLRHSTAPFRAR